VATLTIIPAPAMGIARSGSLITLSWPATAEGFNAQQTTNLAPPILWGPVTNSVSLTGGRYIMNITPVGRNVFYRLIYP
jgi:hypothetical protein